MLDEFVLPEFDAQRPFSLLDSAFSAKVDRSTVEHGVAEATASVAKDLLDVQDVAIDSTLLRFTEGSRPAFGSLPLADVELGKTCGLLDGVQAVPGRWPRSWKALSQNTADDEEEALRAGMSKLARDVGRTIGTQARVKAQNRDALIGQILLSDFDDNIINSDDSSETNPQSVPDRSTRTWKPASGSILPSLWAMASGHSSRSFAWDPATAIFAARDVGGISRTTDTQLLPKHNTHKRQLSNSSEEHDMLRRSDGIEAEQLRPALSNHATRSLIERFQIVGTLQRRLCMRVEAIRNETRATTFAKGLPESPEEAFALASGVSDVLTWTSGQIDLMTENAQNSGSLSAWAALAEVSDLLQGLAEMMKCGLSLKPPFTPLLDTRAPAISTHAPTTTKKHAAQIVSLVYVHLVVAVDSCTLPLLIVALRFILTRVTLAWRKQVVNWIGWPCRGLDRLSDMVEMRMMSGREARQHNYRAWTSKDANTDRCEPWSGVEVEWGWDERGELDVGYVLRPVRLPLFTPIAIARDLLEAGRALRLLQRAAPAGHPLLTLRDRRGENGRQGLKVPIWRWNGSERCTLDDDDDDDDDVHQYIQHMRREIAAWRRYKVHADSAALSVRQDRPRSGAEYVASRRHDTKKSTSPLPAEALSGQQFSDALAVYDRLPGAGVCAQEPATMKDSNIDSQSFASFYNATKAATKKDTNEEALPATTASVASVTINTLFAPMLRWSRLVNASLISVFFRDLHLIEYLDICRGFLVLGNQQFAARVAELLFDDGTGTATWQSWAGGKVSVRSVNGIGLSGTLRSYAAWPPGGSDLATTLNAAVMDSVAKCRAQKSSRSHKRPVQRTYDPIAEGASDQVLLDLDDRLSFAIAKPSSRVHANAHERHSIEALDWLTISFQPPPMIAPLITLQVQLSYQRLFGFLLRLMRVDSVLKAVFRQLMTRGETTGLPDWMDAWDVERASRFRYEAHHFVAVLFFHTTDVVIDRRWQTFRSRLSALFFAAESHDENRRHENNAGRASEDEHGNATSDAGGGEEGGGLSMDDGATDVGTPAVVGCGAAASDVALKDVFSIAAYHERTLDRMLTGCFLKARQKAIMSIIVDMFNLVLTFGQSMQPVATGATDGMTDGVEASRSLGMLLARFQSKSRLLLHALDLIGQRAMNRGDAGPLGTPLRSTADVSMQSDKRQSAISRHPLHRQSEGEGRRTAASSARLAAVDAEIARQEEETRRDLMQLERDERTESMRDLEMIQALMVALQGR